MVVVCRLGILSCPPLRSLVYRTDSKEQRAPHRHWAQPRSRSRAGGATESDWEDPMGWLCNMFALHQVSRSYRSLSPHHLKPSHLGYVAFV